MSHSLRILARRLAVASALLVSCIAGPAHAALIAPGVYAVGTSQPTLKKLANVAAQLQADTLSGNVIYELDATYDGTIGETLPIVLPAVKSQGGPWSVTIRVQAGAGMRTTSGAPANAVIELRDADRYVLDGREGGAGATSAWTIAHTIPLFGSAAMSLRSLGAGQGCVGNTLRYLTLRAADPNLTGNDIYGLHVGNLQGFFVGGGLDNDGNTFDHLTVTSARWGIALRGSASDLGQDNVVRDCIVGNGSSITKPIARSGIFVEYQNAATISGNTISGVGAPASVGATPAMRSGIALGAPEWTTLTSTVTNCIVVGNQISEIVDLGGVSSFGILVAGGAGSGNNLVANNMIRSVRANARGGNRFGGIGVLAGDGDRIVFNSIALSGDLDPAGAQVATASGAGLYVGADSVKNLTVLDNAISVDVSSDTGSLQHYAIVMPSAGFAWGGGRLDYNDYFAATANPQCILGAVGTATPYAPVTTLAAWRALFAPAQDAHSLAVAPPFVSATDLHLLAGSPSLLESGGAPVSGVATDADGDVRSATTPDIGADEAVLTPVAIAAELGSPGDARLGVVRRVGAHRVACSLSGVQPAQQLRADVRDVRGRVVARLDAGTRRDLTWDGRDSRGGVVARGVYWLQVDAGAARLERRFVLVD